MVEKKINKGRSSQRLRMPSVSELMALMGKSHKQRDDKLSRQKLGASTLINNGSMVRIEGCKLQIPKIEAREVQPVDRLTTSASRPSSKESGLRLLFAGLQPDSMICWNLIESTKTY